MTDRAAPRHCGCEGHWMPGVSHVAPCCDVPHCDDLPDAREREVMVVTTPPPKEPTGYSVPSPDIAPEVDTLDIEDLIEHPTRNPDTEGYGSVDLTLVVHAFGKESQLWRTVRSLMRILNVNGFKFDLMLGDRKITARQLDRD
jgi:hypothetical protein